MRWESALGSSIEVAVALAGFSGIVAAVGRRGEGQWTPADQLRLRVLITASATALIESFLPFLLVDRLGDALTWRLGSGGQAAWLLAISIRRFRQASLSGVARAIGMGETTAVLQSLAFLALVANAVWLATPELYVFGVLWHLMVGFSAFAMMLLNTWKPVKGEGG